MSENYLQKLLDEAGDSAKDKPEHSGINTFCEKTLHAVLKCYFESDKSKHEVPCKGYIADIKNENKIVEIQTRSLRNLCAKLDAFSAENEVLVVYPVKIRLTKRQYKTKVRWLTTDRTVSVNPEKSIQTMTVGERVRAFNNFFVEMFGVANFACNKNIKFCAIFVEVDKIKKGEVEYKRGKRVKTRIDTDNVPKSIFEEVYFTEPADWFEIVGLKFQKPFSVQEYAESAGLEEEQAKLVLYLLTRLNLLEKTGKRGSYVYLKKTSGGNN